MLDSTEIGRNGILEAGCNLENTGVWCKTNVCKTNDLSLIIFFHDDRLYILRLSSAPFKVSRLKILPYKGRRVCCHAVYLYKYCCPVVLRSTCGALERKIDARRTVLKQYQKGKYLYCVLSDSTSTNRTSKDCYLSFIYFALGEMELPTAVDAR